MLLGIIFPYEATVIPLYYDFQDFGILNTYWALILPQIGQSVAFGTFWMRAFFLLDAARRSPRRRGSTARELRRADRVLLPQARPALLTLCALVFTYTWNEFLLALVLVSRRAGQADGAAGAQLLRRRRPGPATRPRSRRRRCWWPRPIVIVYIFLQRHFIRGMLAGAVKG